MPWKDKETERAYWREYRKNHREEIRARDRKAQPARSKRDAAKKKAAYQANIEVRRQKNRESYQKHKEARLEYQRKYRAENPEKILERNRQYTETHQPERRAYRLATRERRNAQSRAWRQNNPDMVRAGGAKRRAAIANAPVNDLTAAQWLEIQVAFKFRCAYCGKKSKRLEMDHIIPLSKGGSHTAQNIVPACKPCNTHKHAGPVLVPVQPLLFTLEPPRQQKGA